MKSQANTAILFFSRTVAEEAGAKTFAKQVSHATNASIANHLIKHTTQVAKNSNLPLFNCYSSEQKGASFGERLANAIEGVFEAGYDKVIAIGNDCLTTTSELLVEADQQLNRHHLVLGPAADGGVYLVGLDRSAYQREAFIGLDWNANTLQASLADYAKNQGAAPTWLGQHGDIDNSKDLEFFLETSISRLKFQLVTLLMPTKVLQAVARKISVALPVQARHFALRAPPY